MKKLIPLVSVVLLMTLVLFSFRMGNKKQHQPEKKVIRTGMAVVELFTSEGCSSCPPADELLSKIEQEYKSNVYVLGFHVDYWNRLGWKDVFSTAANTERQQQYAAVLGLQSIYTPQVIVNGKTECTGSDESRLRKAIEGALDGGPGIPLSVTAKINAVAVEVSCKVKDGSDGLLNIALVQMHAASAVKSGENAGRHLLHVNVVRDFITRTLAAGNEGNIILQMPKGLSAKDCIVIAFVQDKHNFHIIGSATAAIQ